jgi:DNA-binding MarR family transcriptional regulator
MTSDAGSADVRVALDSLRRIVQALRVGAPPVGQRPRLSSAQLFALQQIAEHRGASINDIAALTYTHQSSVSVVIQRLVARRLVVKQPVEEDRRRHRLAVTAAGRRLLKDAPAAVQQRLIAAIAALPATQRQALARTLRAIARRVTPKGAPAYPPMLFEDAVRGKR